MEINNNEFITDNVEVIDSNKLNKEIQAKMFSDREFKSKDPNNITEDEFKENLNKLLKSDNYIKNKEYFTSENEYIPKKTDPYNRIITLRNELLKSKCEIDESISHFNDTSIIKENEGYSTILSNFNENKNKIDAFINYEIFNRKDESDSSEESDESASSQRSQKSGSSKKSDNSKDNDKLYSIYEKYERISDNLLSQIKQLNIDLINGDNKTTKIEYQIISNPITKMETLINRLSELEDMINRLEKTVGNWDVSKFHECISMTVSNLVNFISSNMGKKYETRYQIFKEFGNILTENIDNNKEGIEIAKKFAIIKECYQVYETYRQFVNLIDYVKLRLKAIIEVCQTSEQFNSSLNELDNMIRTNETRMELLSNKYKDTLEAFGELNEVLKEMGEIDNIIKNKI